MGSDKIRISDYDIECYNINTLIIGSGVASLNAALSLHSMCVKNIMIVTSDWSGGTSNNAGSDKQTYYKLSLSGKVPDSVIEMAKDLFEGRCMHGDIALCEAQGSVQAFMHLVGLGVGFPRDKFGAFPGYKTDHDPRARATSAGPRTSQKMFEALASEVRKREIRVLNHHHCVALLTDQSGFKVIGALALNTGEQDYKKAFVIFNSTNIILGTGGPAGIYETSVYPPSQSGSTGMAFLAGASGQNLTESQFGIASLQFRWNLSGSYQQVIPRYFSTNIHGKDEKEFLNDFFPDLRTLTKAIFLKGYQWPFDPRKINNYGSSLIDVLINNEINQNHRNVYIDYTRNPSGRDGDSFSLDNLDPEVENYMRNSGALKKNPLDRLKALNLPAYNLYLENGIDLEKENLQVAVCAQHNNGGLKTNMWWESDLRHLFPVGEVNGTHGVYRPGGAALNSGQVGSYRAAQYISKNYQGPPQTMKIFLAGITETVAGILDLSDMWMSKASIAGNAGCLKEIRKRMTGAGGIFRNRKKAEDASAEAFEMIERLTGELGAGSVKDLSDCFLLNDHCITHFIYLKTISFYIENGGRSRGSFIISDSENIKISDKSGFLAGLQICNFEREIERKIIEVVYKNKNISFKAEEVREIPEQKLWFEKVWKEYREDISYGC